MLIPFDRVLTIDDFDTSYSAWRGRTMTIMGEQIKVSQRGIANRYFDTVYLFEKYGILVGFRYDTPLNECYISNEIGFESVSLVDVFPYVISDKGKLFCVVKKQYRNVDLKRMVIGINLIEIPSMDFVYQKKTWPIWESIEDIQNGAVIIKKSEDNYSISAIDNFPNCNLVQSSLFVRKDKNEENVYYIKKPSSTTEDRIDLTKKLTKIKI